MGIEGAVIVTVTDKNSITISKVGVLNSDNFTFHNWADAFSGLPFKVNSGMEEMIPLVYFDGFERVLDVAFGLEVDLV